jgi:hypothetical protein
MGKLVRNLIIGIVIAIVASFIVRGIAKSSAQAAYNTYLQNEQKDIKAVQIDNAKSNEENGYEIIQVDNAISTGNNFVNSVPHFSLNLPTGLSLVKALDNSGIVGYVGETDTVVCQLQIIDTYTLTNMKSKNIERKMLDYNMYAKASMDAAYDGLVKSTIASSPYGEVINIEHSVQKINNSIFIYIKYEIPDTEESMIRKSYNFLINGYTVTVVGLYFKNDLKAGSEIDNYLKSIKFD